MKNLIIKFLTYCFLLVFVCDYAHAYIDPATGTLIIQSLVALVAATFVFCRDSIKLLFCKVCGKGHTDESAAKQESSESSPSQDSAGEDSPPSPQA